MKNQKTRILPKNSSGGVLLQYCNIPVTVVDVHSILSYQEDCNGTVIAKLQRKPQCRNRSCLFQIGVVYIYICMYVSIYIYKPMQISKQKCCCMMILK